jgi:hypothetical protein
MKNDKPGTALRMQSQEVNFWEAQPDVNLFEQAMATGIKKNSEVKRLQKDLKIQKAKAGKIIFVKREAEKNKALQIKKAVNEGVAQLLLQTKKGKKLLKRLHQYACKLEKSLVVEYTGEGGVIEKLDKMIQKYATAKAIAEQKRNDEEIARAAAQTAKKKEEIVERAVKWEGKGNIEKAEQLKQEAEDFEVVPNIILEDPKNWVFNAFVVNKRQFLKDIADGKMRVDDLSGIIIQKSLLNVIAKVIMSGRPREYQSTSWGYCKGRKIK